MLKAFKTIAIFSIDFTKPWWLLIMRQKWVFLTILTVVTIIQVFWSIVPFVAAKIFEAPTPLACLILLGTWLFIDMLCSLVRVHLNTFFQLSIIHSIYHNAYSYLLTIDPHYHLYRSSGAVIAKIERGARSYEDFLDFITFELIPLIMGLGVVLGTFAYYSWILTGVMALFIGAILGVGYYFSHYRYPAWEKVKLAKDDAFKGLALENLMQISFIRSTFATAMRNNKLYNAIIDNVTTESSVWFCYGYLFTGLAILYNFSLIVLALFLFSYIQAGLITITAAVGLFMVYIQSSKDLVRFGRLLRKIMHSKAAIKDLFSFIPTVGTQTFPVLGPSSIAVDSASETTIHAEALSFDYGKAVLFNNHTFSLECPRRQLSTLYGIIGPSGSGKTTFLSILGGQLKPLQGSVRVNGINIYAVNDADRAHLIALQGQVASTVRGTIKSNLLLGLPDDHPYSDDDLEKILHDVGLLSVLQHHQGLHTVLGEGGLNVSGGQRQRLQFAGLYLRAQYYKPLLVLIDEPTSSLDEVSEAAITRMIEQLAHEAVVLVVAHRLKTLEKAVGIIDFSLLAEEKQIRVYTPAQLQQHSVYYRALREGKVLLD